MRRADHDPGRPAVEDAVAAADDRPAVGSGAPREAEARAPVVLVLADQSSVEPRRGELWVRVAHVTLRDVLEVVAEAEVQREVGRDLPLVGDEPRIVGQVRVRRRAGRSGPGERLDVPLARAVRRAALEGTDARERVGAREVARKEVQDLVLVVVEARLERVAPEENGRRIRALPSLALRRFLREWRSTPILRQ